MCTCHSLLLLPSTLRRSPHLLCAFHGSVSYVPYLSSRRHAESCRTAFNHNMATETVPSAAAPTPKMSRYRSVRRAQEEQTRQPGQYHQDHASPAVPAVPAMPPMPPMPVVPESQPQNDAPISRSMSRYHRRPTTSHATSPNPPPLRSNTIPNAPLEHAKSYLLLPGW